MDIEYQLQMKSQGLRRGHRTPHPCQWLGWIEDSSFLAAYKHKFISVSGESSLSPAQPSPAQPTVWWWAHYPGSVGLDALGQKIPVFATWVVASQWMVFGTKWIQCKVSLTRIVQQSASSLRPIFSSVCDSLVVLFCWSETFVAIIVRWKHVQKRHAVTIGLISMYAVHMMVNTGIRIVGHLGVGGSVSHNLLMGREEWEAISQGSKKPPALLGVLVNHHRASSGDMSSGCETVWNFTEYCWARSGQGTEQIRAGKPATLSWVKCPSSFPKHGVISFSGWLI